MTSFQDLIQCATLCLVVDEMAIEGGLPPKAEPEADDLGPVVPDAGLNSAQAALSALPGDGQLGVSGLGELADLAMVSGPSGDLDALSLGADVRKCVPKSVVNHEHNVSIRVQYSNAVVAGTGRASHVGRQVYAALALRRRAPSALPPARTCRLHGVRRPHDQTMAPEQDAPVKEVRF